MGWDQKVGAQEKKPAGAGVSIGIRDTDHGAWQAPRLNERVLEQRKPARCGQELALAAAPSIVSAKVCLSCLASRGHPRPRICISPLFFKRPARELASQPPLFPQCPNFFPSFFLLRDGF